MQSSVAAIRRGRLQAHFVTTSGHHRIRHYGLTEPSRGRLVPAVRSPRQPGARSQGQGAGGAPTASAVVGDLLGLGAGRAVPYAVERRPLAHVVRGEHMAWTRAGSPARRHGVNPTAAWRD